MALSFETPLHPPVAAQTHLQTLSLHSSALLLLAPSIRSYPSMQASTWLFEFELQVSFAPFFDFATAVQSLHAALVVAASLAHALVVYLPSPHVVH
jgi:hypothetical protein